MTLVCRTGCDPTLGWCSPCRSIGDCLEFRPPNDPESRSKPRPFKAKPGPTPEQWFALDQLAPWLLPSPLRGDPDLVRGSDAGYMLVNPRQMWALWRKGWVFRTQMADEPIFEKWMITPAAWEHIRGRYENT